MIYGYGRVSTKGQAKDGNSLEVQEWLLKEHGAEVIYMDSFTGTKITSKTGWLEWRICTIWV